MPYLVLKRSGYLLDQHNFSGFPTIGFNLPFYVSKYHVRCDDMLSGGVLCDSHLGSVIWVTNIFESIFGSTNHTANKTHVRGFCWIVPNVLLIKITSLFWDIQAIVLLL